MYSLELIVLGGMMYLSFLCFYPLKATVFPIVILFKFFALTVILYPLLIWEIIKDTWNKNV